MKIKIGFQFKLISMMAVVFLFMTSGIVFITYNVLKESVIDRYYSSGNSVAESASRIVDIDKYLKFSATYEQNNIYYNEFRKDLLKLKTSYNLKNLYTAEVNNSGTVICHVDGNERYGSNFLEIGK